MNLQDIVQFAFGNSGRRSIAVLTAASALSMVALQGTARADFITNGNFSSTTVAGNANSLIYNTSTGASYLTGWNVLATNTSQDLGFVYSGNYGQTVSDQYGSFSLSDSAHITPSGAGGNFIVADGDPGNSLAVYQTLTNLSANTKYILTFYQATGAQSGFSPTGTADWSITFGNSTDGFTAYTSPATSVSSSFSGWQQVSTTFTTGAHATSETLQFLSSGPSGGPPMVFLDGVTLNSATPEPSTLVIGGFGLLALVQYRRKRARG